MTISIESRGRRHYLIGNTYPIKDAIRSAGCKWDPEAKAWYTGKRERAEELVAKAASLQAAPSAPSSEGRDPPGADAKIAGRCTYKGKTYYVAGRVIRGRTHWDDQVAAIESRDGQSVLLYFRDGSKSFWAKLAELQVTKTYDRPQTIAGLQRFADRAKQLADDGRHPPVPGCAQCGQLGHMCPQCEFDEFDN